MVCNASTTTLVMALTGLAFGLGSNVESVPILVKAVLQFTRLAVVVIFGFLSFLLLCTTSVLVSDIG